MMLTGPFNATRHPQRPLPQPNYNFANVPKAISANLEGSALYHVNNRDHFHEAMAEMLLLCKEAMRRRRQGPPAQKGQDDEDNNNSNNNNTTTTATKPLSLEYLADRLDIDDPCFGYLVRTKERIGRRPKKDKDNGQLFQPGMLQGFITVTTFTNWQRTFRWDSLNEAAYGCDSDDLIDGGQKRKLDVDGSLARALNATVRGGDINQEGIVWPRICEISLLGGLGCGQALINLIIEELECMKGNSKANYDYVVLQATHNSIPFYEAMGFVRVGAIMLDETKDSDDDDGESNNSDVDDEGNNNNSGGEKAESGLSSFFTSKVKSYQVKTGETLNRIAYKFQVNVLDLLFLNRHILGDDVQPSDKPKLNTYLFIPAKEEEEETGSVAAAAPTKIVSREDIQWYTAKENDTPRMIAKMFNVDCNDLVNTNKGRHEGLLANSRLKDGTRIRVSHFDTAANDYQAYAHWSFPDARFEDPEPSYMMVQKLNRRSKNKMDYRPFQASLKVPIQPYEPSPLLLPPSPTPIMPAKQPAIPASAKPAAKPSSAPDEPRPPDRPLSAYMLFATEQRELMKEEQSATQGPKSGESARVIRELWNELPATIKAQYETSADEDKQQYRIDKEQYEIELAQFEASTSTSSSSSSSVAPPLPMSVEQHSIKYSLYNKVVKLKEGAMTESSVYKYWYVLTFIPDLKWCHLAPMIQDGVFGPEKSRAQGRPKWKLVDESLGHEVDISSSFVVPIKSKSMRKTLDADKEEWDIIDDGTDPTKMPAVTPRVLSRRDDFFLSEGKRTTAVKPSVERLRKKPPPIAEPASPLFAAVPGSGVLTLVNIRGSNLFDEKRPRGRPKGSKNKQKASKKTSFIGKRRTSSVKFDIPATVRKAAALRGSDKKPRALPDSESRGRKQAAESSVDFSDSDESSELEESMGHWPNRRRLSRTEQLPSDPSESSSDSTYNSHSSAESSSESEDASEDASVEPVRSSPRLKRASVSPRQLRRSSRTLEYTEDHSDSNSDDKEEEQVSSSDAECGPTKRDTGKTRSRAASRRSSMSSQVKPSTRAAVSNQNVSPSRPRRSAAPTFLGEPHMPPEAALKFSRTDDMLDSKTSKVHTPKTTPRSNPPVSNAKRETASKSCQPKRSNGLIESSPVRPRRSIASYSVGEPDDPTYEVRLPPTHGRRRSSLLRESPIGNLPTSASSNKFQSSTRPKRKSAPTFLGESPSTKRRRVLHN